MTGRDKCPERGPCCLKLIRLVLTLVGTLFLVLTTTIVPARAAGENILYISSKDNDLYYDSTLFQDARFMSHLSMDPGDTFHDELTIDNGSKRNYDLFFQVIPVQQPAASDSLLENMTMKVFVDGQQMYSGKVTGKDYTGNGVNLRNVIPMGRYTPGKQSLVTVDLQFSPDYQPGNKAVNARIDWRFWATGQDSGTQTVKPVDRGVLGTSTVKPPATAVAGGGPASQTPNGITRGVAGFTGFLPTTGDQYEWLPISIGIILLISGGGVILITRRSRQN